MIETILMPTDGSPTAQAAADIAKDIALAENASVIVLGVVHTIVYPDTAAIDSDAAAEPATQAVVDEQVKRMADVGVSVTGRTVHGAQVHQAIADVAKEVGADLIVMGTHGRTGLSRAVIGSVADRVVRHTAVPVLLVPKRD